MMWKYHRKQEFGKICEVLNFPIPPVFLVLLFPVVLGCRRGKAHALVLWTHLQGMVLGQDPQTSLLQWREEVGHS